MARQRDAITILADHESALRQMRATLARIGAGPEVSVLNDLSDVTITTPATRHGLMYDGVGWVNRFLVEADISDLGSYSLTTHDHDADYSLLGHTHLEADITDLQNYSLVGHAHSGADITSGTVAFARLPTGTGSSQVAVGNHLHSGTYLPLTGGTLTNDLTIVGGPKALALKAGASADHTYMEFYADSAAQSTRSGYLGYAAAGTTILRLTNEMGTVIEIGGGSAYFVAVAGGSSSATRISTNDGYIDVGPQNIEFGHIYTDRPKFAFNKSLYVVSGGYQHGSLPPYNNSNGSMRWPGTAADMQQAHTSSSQEYKAQMAEVDLDKSVFMRLHPIWFTYEEDHPYRDRWIARNEVVGEDGKVTIEEVDNWKGFENPSVGRLGFVWEEMAADPETAHWTYEAEGMKAVSYEGMLPDFMGFTVAAIQQLHARVAALEAA